MINYYHYLPTFQIQEQRRREEALAVSFTSWSVFVLEKFITTYLFEIHVFWEWQIVI